MNKKQPLLALVLLPAFFLLQNYNELIGFIETHQIIVYAIVIYGILTVAYFIFRKSNISAPKTTLILFVTGVFFLFFTPIHDLLNLITFNTILNNYWISFPLICLILILLVRKIIKLKNVPTKLVQLLNLTMILLVSSSIVTLILDDEKERKDHDLIYPAKPVADKYVSQQKADSSKPDIYFLLFDEYTNSKTLKKIWNFDNSPITDWLKEKNFYVPDSTKSNYNFTLFSLSSTFNLNYLDQQKGADGTITGNLMKANQSLSDNETFSILQKENYSINFLAPFRNKIQENKLGHFFDYIINRQMFLQTLPGNAFQRIGWHLKSGHTRYSSSTPYAELQDKYQLVRRTVDEIKETADTSTNRKPHFVYGHLMITHTPYVFDSAGKIMSEDEVASADLFHSYLSQVNYANQVIKELIDYIKTHNKKNTVIIIMGDHGFRHFSADLMQANSFSNLCAISFPDSDYSRLNNHISPVNIFRVVFDKYFNLQLPLLKDSCINVKDQF